MLRKQKQKQKTKTKTKKLTMISGRLVAATTVTFTKGSIPSISFNNCESTRSATDEPPPSPPPRFTVNASISS